MQPNVKKCASESACIQEPPGATDPSHAQLCLLSQTVDDEHLSPQGSFPEDEEAEDVKEAEHDGLDAKAETVPDVSAQVGAPKRDGEGDDLADHVDELEDGARVGRVAVHAVRLERCGSQLEAEIG